MKQPNIRAFMGGTNSHGPPVRMTWEREVKDQVPTPDPMLMQEASIIFTDLGMRLKPRYVRWAWFTDNTLRNPPPFRFTRSKAPRVVGYSTLKAGWAGSMRRVFWLTDRDVWQFEGCPAEAVDPLTLFAGYRGRRTSRARVYQSRGN